MIGKAARTPAGQGQALEQRAVPEAIAPDLQFMHELMMRFALHRKERGFMGTSA